MNYQTNAGLLPAEFYITKNRQRVKQYTDTVYLNSGDEYELELFNPNSIKVLAKVSIDGEYISTRGIIVNPGQRVILERYIDTPDKFKYTTYEVSGKSDVVENAIRNNGVVTVDFHAKSAPNPSYNPWNNPYYYGNTNIGGSSGGTSSGTFYRSDVTTTSRSIADFYPTTTTTSTTLDMIPDMDMGDLSRSKGTTRSKLAKKETGMTEKGSVSNQNFTHSSDVFDRLPFNSVTWKILPTSQKPVTAKHANTLYCGNCGARQRKTSHKFCPICGSKY